MIVYLIIAVLASLLLALAVIFRNLWERDAHAAAVVVLTMELLVLRSLLLRIHGEDADVPYLLTFPENSWVFTLLNNSWLFLALHFIQLGAVAVLVFHMWRESHQET